MNYGERINAFAELGSVLRSSLKGEGKWAEKIASAIQSQQYENPWFTPVNVRYALEAIAGQLTSDNLKLWLSSYPEIEELRPPEKILVIMAGNIPLVGFHDFLSVLITGKTIIARKSTKDGSLIDLVKDILVSAEPRFAERIIIAEREVSGFDAVIATGSDNTSRYFEYYFGKYPNIIRKNRNSVAILKGHESTEDLILLGRDVFTYFGLGCRNISRLWLPEGMDPEIFTEAWKEYSDVVLHSKYANNYDYNKAVFLVNRVPFTDTGYLLIRENPSLSSPVSVLHYTYYKKIETAEIEIESFSGSVQCICGEGHLPFGKAQMPQLWDYADGTDTIEFLLKKNSLRN